VPRLSPRTPKILERIAREEHELAAVQIGTPTMKPHFENVHTCDVTKSLGPLGTISTHREARATRRPLSVMGCAPSGAPTPRTCGTGAWVSAAQ